VVVKRGFIGFPSEEEIVSKVAQALGKA